MKGIEIIFKDGEKDWVDPVNDDLADTIEPNQDGNYVINNGHADYIYIAKDIHSFAMYTVPVTCEVCNGSGEGHYERSQCNNCNGSGSIMLDE